MEQTSFEQAVIDALREVPAKQQAVVLRALQALARELRESGRPDGRTGYSVERHRGVRELTATVGGSLAADISAERDERG